MPILSLSIAVVTVLTQHKSPKSAAFGFTVSRVFVDEHGYITSLKQARSQREYLAAGHPSPILSLHEVGKPISQLVFPISSLFDKKSSSFRIKFPNGSVAVVHVSPNSHYLKLQLLSLSNRGKVDNIVWGPIHTKISQYIGDIIGVVRDEHFAVGLFGIDDNTISGPPAEGDSHGLGYYVHTFDSKKWPVPHDLKEGQWFNLGGDGISDVAFSSHPDEFFQQIGGLGAKLEPTFGSTIAYHSRDRRKSYTQKWSLLPGFPRSRPRTQVSDPAPGVDFIGSTVALYACPTDLAPGTLRKIVEDEPILKPKIDGRWVHDPALLKPDIAWNGGPHDKMIEYAEALTLNAVQDEGQGEYYANPADHWLGKRVAFSGNRSKTYKEFTDDCRKHGIKYGLHTLCLFLQPGRCSDVTPVASDHLQTVCRTTLERDLTDSEMSITVSDPSYLAEKGTWPMGDDSNIVQIGGELIQVDVVSKQAPWTMRVIKRGFGGTKPQNHKAGLGLAKLQQNCYGGFCPDMSLMESYADYYASVMVENGMEYIDFDGLESTLYMNQGYFGVKRFMRRFFETYSKLTHGKAPRVMGAGILPGEWEFVGSCNVGGGNNMFDPILNHWGTEGKDIRHMFQNSFLAPTFGIQDYHSDWSLYDAENLQAKSVAWDATYMLGLTEDAVEKSGEKAAIFSAFRAWENARAANVFLPAQKEALKDLTSKFHLKQTGRMKFLLTPVKELRTEAAKAGNPIQVLNPNSMQPLHLAARIKLDKGVEPGAVVVTLPDGTEVRTTHAVKDGEFVLIDGDKAYQADRNRKQIAVCAVAKPAVLPAGSSQFTVACPKGAQIQFVLWSLGKPQSVGH